MIALVDYGIGNLRSVEKALRAAGGEVELTSDPEAILAADKVVLPGVGAFGDGMAGLAQRGLDAPIKETVTNEKPFLGICLGMQLLFESSDELGQHAGLGLLAGRVERFPASGLKIPQTGWNQLHFSGQGERVHPLLAGLEPGAYAYFNHGYYCRAEDQSDVIAEVAYGIRYPGIVGRGRLLGVQFHPEKSQQVGLQLLRNFVERC